MSFNALYTQSGGVTAVTNIDNFPIPEAARRYVSPLIGGESYPPYRRILPAYRRFELDAYRVAKTLDSY